MPTLRERTSLTIGNVIAFTNIKLEEFGLDESVATDILNMMIDTCCEYVTEYLNNSFTDEDGVELDVPQGVKLAILRMVNVEMANSITDRTSPLSGRIVKEKANLLERWYADNYGSSQSNAYDEICLRYLDQYRLAPL